MHRREMLGAVGLGAAGLLAMGGDARADHTSQLSEMEKKCVEACHECATACDEASQHCLMELEEGRGDRQHHARAHHLTADCASLCHLTGALIARKSPVHGDVCQACAEVCRKCAEECEKSQGAPIMKDCARLCRDCEKSCREMARLAATHH